MPARWDKRIDIYMGEDVDPDEIRIRLDRLEPFLGAPAGSPFHEGRISEEADRFLRNRVGAGEIVDRQRQNDKRNHATARNGQNPCARGRREDVLIRFSGR